MTAAITRRPGRKLGLWMCTALVMGNMVGSGIFLLPASLGVYGGVSLVGWLVSGTGAGLLALTFAQLARVIPRTGGPYAFTRAAFGEFPAFLVAWGYWLSICAGNAAIAVAMVGYLGVFWPALASNPGLGAAIALLAIWVLTWVNTRGVRIAGGVQLVTTALKLLPLAAIGTLGLAFVRWEHLTPFNLSGRSTFSAVSATAALTLWAFLGLESATIPAEEVDRPTRTIPLATVLGTGVTAAGYVLATVAVMGVLPSAVLARSSAPFADAASLMWGPWAADAVAAGAVISCFGALNGWILLEGRLPLAAAADGLLPPVLARMSGRGTPAVALAMSSALVTLVVATNYTKGLVPAFTFIILLSTLTTLIPCALSCLALLRLRRGHGNALPGGLGAAAPVIAGLAFLYSAWAIVGTGPETIVWAVVLLATGIPPYVWLVRRGRRGSGPAAPTP